MLLKSLDIQGFKTFADRIALEFSPGITCLVGPNGSGKSNVADAILWVLGESNIRELRGSQNQDVIFAGNNRRRGSGMAQVSLTVDNSAGRLPLDWSEVTVTRRLYRSGDSEFLINNVRCRLRDIYELFLDTGVGRDAYALIGQGQIDEILSVRAEERRSFFEEAAGVKKYRVRRRETERRLAATSLNLLRVGDILSEVEAQLGPLQRQARAAERYRGTVDELSRISAAYYGIRVQRLRKSIIELETLTSGLKAERERLQDESQLLREEETEAASSVADLEREEAAARAEIDAARELQAELRIEKVRADERDRESRRRLIEIDRGLADLQKRVVEQEKRLLEARRSEEEARSQLAAAEREVDATLASLSAAAARETELAAAVGRLRDDWRRRENLRSQHQLQREKKAARIEALNAALAQNEPAQADLARDLEQSEAEILEASDALAGCEARLSALRDELLASGEEAGRITPMLAAAKQERRAAAAELSEQSARLKALRAVAAGMQSGVAEGSAGPTLLSSLHPPADRAAQVAALLRGRATARFAESLEAAVARLCEEGEGGRSVWYLPGAPEASIASESKLPAWLKGPSCGLEWIAAWTGRVSESASLDDAVRERETLKAAGRLQAADLWLTPDGAWLSGTGEVGRGAPAGIDAESLLRSQAEVREIEAALPGLEAAAAAAESSEAELEQRLAGAREHQSQARASLDSAERELATHRRRVDEARRRSDRGRKRLAQLEAALELDRDTRSTLEAELEAMSAEPSEESEQGSDSQGLRDAEASLKEAEAGRRTAEQVSSAARTRRGEALQRVSAAEESRKRAAEGWAYLERQQADRSRERGELSASQQQQALDFGGTEERLRQAEAALASGQARLQETAGRRSELQTALAAAREKRDAGVRGAAEISDRLHRSEVELLALRTEETEALRAWSEIRLLAADIAGEDATEPEEPGELFDDWDAEAAAALLAETPDALGAVGRLRRQLRAMGPINPEAPTELAALQERFDHLRGQREDLETAQSQLQTAITEIDAASREAFVTTFERIAEAFDLMFKRLFGGGATELKLTDPEDVLESGVDILVQAPGKKVQNLLLLSGGERALTAAAMLFALLTVRPSPFCVLDEVDAALDEANVRRFASLVRDFSEHTQFIVITHNRITMEGADRLYGVTMEERGVSRILGCRIDDGAGASAQVEADAARLA